MVKVFDALDRVGQKALDSDLQKPLKSMNRGEDISLVIPTEYLEIVATLCHIAANQVFASAADSSSRPLRAQARSPATTRTNRTDSAAIQTPELTGWRSKVAA